MFSKHVLDAFEGELEKYGEIYPVECDAGPYYLYRVTHIIKAMNLKAISLIDPRYAEDSDYNSISSSKYEFISDNISELLLFKDIYARPPRNVFLGEQFIETLKQHRFSGVATETFKPIWPRG